MLIHIDNHAITIDGHTLQVYPYYFGIWDRERDATSVLADVLVQWASCLLHLRAGEEYVLPYSLDDQSVACLAARLDGDKVELSIQTAKARRI
jgi:hypothetical protein